MMNAISESRELAEALFKRAEKKAAERGGSEPAYFVIGALQYELESALAAAPAKYRKQVAERLSKSSPPVAHLPTTTTTP